MSDSAQSKPLIAIACGGTGGHLFPGLAVANLLQQRGCDVALIVSPKEVDQQAAKTAAGMRIITLPAVGLQNRNYFSFARSFWASFRAARKNFKEHLPEAVLAMGGFTSAPPIFAGRMLGAKTFLHESNTIPGRANRMLARWVDAAFIGFPETEARLNAKKITVTGTPVRAQFSTAAASQRPAAECRTALGLAPERPTLLVVGGSQGARGLNDLILSALPLLARNNWQWLHLTGPADFEKVQSAYLNHGIQAVVKPFLAEMDLALGAATACVSRAGASSIAEMAALRLPAALVPLPTAADNHQYFNAMAVEKNSAARLLNQVTSDPEKVAAVLTELMGDKALRQQMQASLARLHAPGAAADIAEAILSAIGRGSPSGNQPGLGESFQPKTVS